jgi:hypothetical protein
VEATRKVKGTSERAENVTGIPAGTVASAAGVSSISSFASSAPTAAPHAALLFSVPARRRLCPKRA